MKNLLSKILLSICFFIFLIFHPAIILADTIIYEDNFNDGNADGWIVPREPCSGGPWQVQNFKYGIPNPGCVTETIPSSLILTNSPYIYEVDMTIPDSVNQDRNFIFKYRDSSNWYGIHIYGDSIYLQKVVDGIEIGSPFWSGHYTFVADETYHFKIFIYADRFDIEIQGSHIATVYDYSQFDNYSAGLQASGGDTVWFDNFRITTPTPSPTPSPTTIPSPSPSPIPSPSFPSLSVPNIKQYSLPWGPLVYDHAEVWSENPTIDRWGCALTSASMILRFWGHGDYADPGPLNEWLKNQPDGYLSNGLINWLAISRFSRIHSSETSSALEFKSYNKDDLILESELIKGHPVVLKEDGHFIVAKSRTSNSFGINDPAYPDRNTLDFYDNTYNRIYSFTPTHTDLSYILLTTDSPIEITISDIHGNTIPIEKHEEDPLIDDVDFLPAGTTALKVFELQKPDEDNYRVNISGEKGFFIVNIYIYNKNGDVDKLRHVGYLSSNYSTSRFDINSRQKGKSLSRKTPWDFEWFPGFNPWK